MSISLSHNLCEDDEGQGSRSSSLWTQAALVNRLWMSIMKTVAFRARERLWCTGMGSESLLINVPLKSYVKCSVPRWCYRSTPLEGLKSWGLALGNDNGNPASSSMSLSLPTTMTWAALLTLASRMQTHELEQKSCQKDTSEESSHLWKILRSPVHNESICQEAQNIWHVEIYHFLWMSVGVSSFETATD